MNPRQTAKTTFLFTLSFLLLLLVVPGTVKGNPAQAGTNKPNQVANAVSPAPATPAPNPKETGTGPAGAVTQNQKNEGTAPVSPPRWTVDQGIKEFRWVFALMTGALLLIVVLLTIALVHISRPGVRQWSLGDALSEESSIQPPPAEIHGRDNVIMLASASRLIALVGLLAAVPIVIGVGYAIAWNLIVNGSCPDLTGVRGFLIGLSLTFAPYLANQVRSIFDPRVGTPQTPTTVSQAPVQPTPPVTQGQGTTPPLGPLPPPSPVPTPSSQPVSRAGLVEVNDARGIPIAHIDRLEALTDKRKELLLSHGVRTAHQLVGTAHAAESALAEFLSLTPGELQRLLSKIPNYEMLRPAHRKAQPKFPMGARLDLIPRFVAPPTGSGLASTGPAPEIDLMRQMPPVRDQGQVRETCVAFAALAVFEQYLNLQNGYVGLSEQFLYWACKQTDGNPNERGTFLAWAMPLLQRDGCCPEFTWQYNASETPGNEGEGPPPSQAMAEAANHRITSYHQLNPNSIDAIKSELARDRCVAFTIPIFQSSSNNDEVKRTGEFVNPLPTGDAQVGGHSMCFVGYRDSADDPALGGGTFYLRNSWDAWATESVLQMTGYGTISYSYIAAHCVEAYSIN